MSFQFSKFSSNMNDHIYEILINISHYGSLAFESITYQLFQWTGFYNINFLKIDCFHSDTNLFSQNVRLKINSAMNYISKFYSFVKWFLFLLPIEVMEDGALNSLRFPQFCEDLFLQPFDNIMLAICWDKTVRIIIFNWADGSETPTTFIDLTTFCYAANCTTFDPLTSRCSDLVHLAFSEKNMFNDGSETPTSFINACTSNLPLFT